MARQEATLGNLLDSATVHRDTVGKTERRAHRPASLVERGLMLSAASESPGITLSVASLAVLAWSPEDFAAVAQAVVGQGGTITAVLDGVTIDGKMSTDRALVHWIAARSRSRIEGAAKRGAANSARVRKAATDAGITLIASRWPLPSSEWSTAALLAEAGVSRNTANDRLGGRETAQRLHLAGKSV